MASKTLLENVISEAGDALKQKAAPSKVLTKKNLTQKRGAFASCFIAAFILALLAMVGAVYVNAIDVSRFETVLVEHVDYASLGVSEDSVRSFASETILYLTDEKAAWEPQITIAGIPASSFIPQSFRDHMADVKGWVSSAAAVFLAGAAIVVTLLSRAITSRKAGLSLGGYYLGALIPLLVVAGVGLWAYVDFESMWMLLHKTLIPDGIFSAAETVMQLFPLEAFAAYLPPVVKSFGLFAAGVLLLPLPLWVLSALMGNTKRK